MAAQLGFRFLELHGGSVREVSIEQAVLAGWSGRDRAAVEAHIQELAALGVAPPSSAPLFYRVSPARLSRADEIEVCGENSSGEVEFVLVTIDAETWIGAGSDHTDRRVEAYSVAVSKQMCDKPLAPDLWRFPDVAGHWDELVLRSWIVEGDQIRLYQEGGVCSLLHPSTLLEKYGAGKPQDGTAIFSGTVPAIGGVRPSERFLFELEDPVLQRSIRHEYRIRVLPLVQ
jgi:hypothetical protein